VIAGINLPMLIRLAGARKSMNVIEATQAAQTAGRNYITIASELLGAGAGSGAGSGTGSGAASVAEEAKG
jgi:PTS system mannose-specific IIA component